jgi:hypothetical protein
VPPPEFADSWASAVASAFSKQDQHPRSHADDGDVTSRVNGKMGTGIGDEWTLLCAGDACFGPLFARDWSALIGLLPHLESGGYSAVQLGWELSSEHITDTVCDTDPKTLYLVQSTEAGVSSWRNLNGKVKDADGASCTNTSGKMADPDYASCGKTNGNVADADSAAWRNPNGEVCALLVRARPGRTLALSVPALFRPLDPSRATALRPS